VRNKLNFDNDSSYFKNVLNLGNNRYLATSKNVNRVLNQLNGILANGNMTVQTVTTGANTAVTVDLAAGNFVNLTLNTATSGATAITFTNYMPGIYFLKIKTPTTLQSFKPIDNNNEISCDLNGDGKVTIEEFESAVIRGLE